MNKQTLLSIMPYILCIIAVFSIQPYTTFPIFNTTIWWIIEGSILIAFWGTIKFFFDKRESNNMILIRLYLIYNILSVIRGRYESESYWDWKALISNTMVLMVPMVAYISTNLHVFQSIIKGYLKFGLPLFLVFVFVISRDSYGFFLVPVSFLTLFLPVLTLRWKVILTVISIFTIFADFGARSTVIKFSVPFILLLMYYSRDFMTVLLLNIIHKIFMVAPIILFFLAVNGTFNIFRMNDYIRKEVKTLERGKKKADLDEGNYSDDTRTFLYVEVLNSANNHDYWIFGRSPARGNDTQLFKELKAITGRQERIYNEVAILNVFTWTGLVGVLFYLLIFYRASYLAINYSNNFFCKILGIYLAFRWMYSWVEDITDFSLVYVFLWFIIGLCYSKSFRNLSDGEVKLWIREIFARNKVALANLSTTVSK